MGGCFKKTVLFLFLAAAGFIIVNSMISAFSPKRVWETTGPVQALTNGEETWIFFEFSTWRHRPGLLVSSPNIIVGHRQGVVVLSGDGAREYRLKDDDGPTFNPNLSYIFHHDGRFFLLTSLGYGEEALHRWTDGESPRFERLGEDDARRVLGEEGLGDANYFSAFQEHELQPHGGWTRATANSMSWPAGSEPLRFGESILSFGRSSFTLVSPRPPRELVLR